MPQRLRDILDRLYKPPTDGVRQVFALSRGDAENSRCCHQWRSSLSLRQNAHPPTSVPLLTFFA